MRKEQMTDEEFSRSLESTDHWFVRKMKRIEAGRMKRKSPPRRDLTRAFLDNGMPMEQLNIVKPPSIIKSAVVTFLVISAIFCAFAWIFEHVL
jgi:hypothetical protein